MPGNKEVKDATKAAHKDEDEWRDYFMTQLQLKGESKPIYRPIVEDTQHEKANAKSADRRKIPQNILVILWILKYGITTPDCLKLMMQLFINDYFPMITQRNFNPRCTSPEWLNEYVVIPVTQIALSLCSNSPIVRDLYEKSGLVHTNRYATLKKLIQDAITSTLLHDFLQVLHKFGPDPVPLCEERSDLYTYMMNTYCVYNKVASDKIQTFSFLEAIFKSLPGMVRQYLVSEFYNITEKFPNSDANCYKQKAKLKDFHLLFASKDKTTEQTTWVPLVEYVNNVLHGVIEPPFFQFWRKKMWSDDETIKEDEQKSATKKKKRNKRQRSESDEEEEEENEEDLQQTGSNRATTIFNDIRNKAFQVREALNQYNLENETVDVANSLFQALGIETIEYANDNE